MIIKSYGIILSIILSIIDKFLGYFLSSAA